MESLHLPTVNAGLNSTAALFLCLGLFFIKRKNIKAHRWSMTGAFVCSTLFLISYLYYHSQAGTTKFLGQGLIRSFYFALLTSHTILAAVIVPLALITLFWAWKGQFEKHAKIARWTWPVWMYVSVTGVTIYWMLYQMK